MKSLEEIHPYISIHALLAESDAHQNRINKSLPYFYPRSPCGERQCWKRHKCRKSQKFLSTLSLRRATDKVLEAVSRNGISIHALLAESDNGRKSLNALAEYFYPRSPCGERPNFHRVRYNTVDISIHALLAESDLQRLTVKTQAAEISIHALLAESDQQSRGSYIRTEKFLSTLSLRRATVQHRLRLVLQKISIHALLAESDQKQTALLML